MGASPRTADAATLPPAPFKFSRSGRDDRDATEAAVEEEEATVAAAESFSLSQTSDRDVVDVEE